MFASIAVFSALAGSAFAKQCTNVTVPVNINARQGVFDVPTIRGNYDATLFVQNFTKIGQNFTDLALRGYQTVTGLYNISAKFCQPDAGLGANPTVQFLTHGIGFDKSYWDLPFNDYNYSYIDIAVDQYKFATLSIDRFGIGNSSHGDPLNLIQAPAEVSVIHELTQMLRTGTFPSVNHAFGKVVHVGHSFGSAQSYVLSAMYPEDTDAIILTGFSTNQTWLARTLAGWNPHVARLNQPLRFGNITANLPPSIIQCNSDLVQVVQQALSGAGIDATSDDIWNILATTEVGDIINNWNKSVPGVPQDLPTGYLTWSDYTANQYAFLYPGFFDIALGLFGEQTKQPVTLGEIFTLANGAPKTTSFAGPVQIVTGRQDNIYCGGDCLATGTSSPSIPADAKMAFPNATVFEAYIHPNTGHGINVHYNSTGAYKVIQEFLLRNQLGST